MTTKKPNEAVQERAAVYALGALPPEEADAVAAELANGAADLGEEVTAFAAVVEALPYAVRPQAPPPRLRAAVLERIADRATPVLDVDGLRFVRSASTEWQRTPLPGIEVKRLHEDVESGRQTSLVRIAPGGRVPYHRHAGVEEIYLVDGDLVVAGVAMRSGDYCRAEAGTVHDGIRSPGGCVLLVCASVHDEYAV